MILSHSARIDSVLKYIDNNLNERINTAELSAVACFSKFHFHRLFLMYVGVSVGQYVNLMRFKQVSYQLVFRQHLSITDIALNAGFSNTASLSREFKKSLGVSPSRFRQNADWPKWLQIFNAKYEPIKQTLSKQGIFYMSPIDGVKDVHIVHFKQISVAVKEHKGPPTQVMHSVAQFIDWRKENRVSPTLNATYNILHENPNLVEPEDYRFDICVVTDKPIVPKNRQGVIAKVIPAGRCARYRYIGSDEGLGSKIQFMYEHWLPASGEVLRDFPCFIHRINLYPDVPEQQATIDIYLPIQ